MHAIGDGSRTGAYGQFQKLTLLDRAGVWLSARAVRRHAEFAGRRIGDFGAGYDAYHVRAVLDEVASATVIDLSLAEDLKRHPKVKAIEGSLPEVLLGLENASLDVVLCLAIIEHLWDPDMALREVRRILAPGGVALINVPSWRGKPVLEFVAFRLGISRQEMDDHKMYFDPRDLWPLLIRAGFRPSEVRCRRHKLGFATFAVCRVPE
jgi:SAM-dependent methyltransferase